ncbi:hypothetical protein GCM10018954_085950 [Kutzneria kofuensis]
MAPPVGDIDRFPARPHAQQPAIRTVFAQRRTNARPGPAGARGRPGGGQVITVGLSVTGTAVTGDPSQRRVDGRSPKSHFNCEHNQLDGHAVSMSSFATT